MHLRRDEQGSISIMAAVLAAAVVMATSLAVDVGRVAFTSRDQQGVTDRVVLDGARSVAGGWSSLQDLHDQVSASAAQTLTSNTAGSAVGTSRDRVLTNLEVGWVDPNTGDFYVYWDDDGAGPFAAMAATQDPTAFKAYTSSYVDFVFGFLDSEGGRTVTKESIGTLMAQTCPAGSTSPLCQKTCDDFPAGACVKYHPAEAGISVGTRLVEFSTNQTLLGDVLEDLLGTGAGVNLTLVGFDGLATSTITLADLATGLGLGAPSDVLSADIALADLLAAMASGLSNSDPAVQAQAVTAMTELATNAGGTLSVSMPDVVDVSSGGGAALLEADLPVLDLLMASAMHAAIADGNNLVTTSLSGSDLLGLTGLGSIDLDLSLIEAPQIAWGRAEWVPDTDLDGDGLIEPGEEGHWVTRARTAQVDTSLSLTLNAFYATDLLGDLTSVVSGLTCLLSPLLCGDVTVDIGVAAAQATASLTDVACDFDVPELTEISTLLEQEALVATVGSDSLTLADSRNLVENAGVQAEVVVVAGMPGVQTSSDVSVSAMPGADQVLDAVLGLLGVEIGTAEVRGLGFDCIAPELLTIDSLDL